MKNKSKMLPLLSLFVLLWTTSIYGQLADTKLEPNSEDEKAEVDYDLTDQDRFESQNYIHQGKINREMNEACDALKDPGACRGRGKTKFMGIDSNLVEAVSKMYSLFGGMVGANGGMDFKNKAPEAGAEGAGDAARQNADSADVDGEKGKGKKNYCVYIPAAGETLAMFMQQMGQNNIMNEQTTETPQKDALYKAARAHENRAKSSKIQGSVWGATSACYGYYMVAGGVALDWKVIAQAAAAGFLTIFYFDLAKQHEGYAEEVRRIADELPGKGDCNPHTQNNCYCAQPETQYDPVHCVPELHKKAIANTSFAVPCVDKNLAADANCDCVTKEACFDADYFSEVSAPGFVQFGKSSAGNDFKKLTRGELVGGKLSAGSNGNSAAARKLLGNLKSKANDNSALSKSQLGVSDAMENLGMPASLARLIARQPVTNAGRKRAAQLTRGAPGKVRVSSSRRGKGNGVLRFSSGKGRIGTQKKKQGNKFGSMLNKFKKKKNVNNKKVLRFAKEAQDKAQIEKNKDRALFEIISRRYQVSGWRRLDIQ